MTLGAWFWATLIFSILFGAWWFVQPTGPTWRPGVGAVVLVVLLGLLGWAVFQGPVR